MISPGFQPETSDSNQFQERWIQVTLITVKTQFTCTIVIELCSYTLKTGIPVEEGDSILMLMQKVFRPEIQLGVGFV